MTVVVVLMVFVPGEEEEGGRRIWCVCLVHGEVKWIGGRAALALRGYTYRRGAPC